MAEFFGDLERLAADLYPWRWAIAIGVLIVLTSVATLGYRRGWHMVIWRHRLAVAICSAPLLALAGFVGYDLGSPLFTNKTVEEEFPFAFSAIVPPGMDREDVEKVMEMIAKVDQEPMNDPMPEEIAKGIVQSETVSKITPVTPTPSPGVANTPIPTPLDTQAAQQAEPSPTSVTAPTLTPSPTPAPTPIPTAPPTPQSTVVTAAQPGVAKLKTGSLRDQDAFHKGSGEATIYRGPDGSHLLRLENLDVTNGPDLHVILSPNRDPKNQGDVKTTGYVDLGKLKGNKGNQNYPISDDVDIAIQGSVVIYCKPFHVIFSVATLEDVN